MFHTITKVLGNSNFGKENKDMQTTEKKVTIKFYICDNCGTEHRNSNKLRKDYVTSEEICDKCQKQVRLADRTLYYDEYDHDGGEVYGKEVFVNADTVKATEFDLDVDREEYYKRVSQIRSMYIELMDKLDTAYLQDRVRGFNLKGYNLDESERW